MIELCEPATIRGLKLRAADEAEVTGLLMTPRKALRYSWGVSVYRRAAMIDGGLAAAWGVGGSLIGRVGTPWLLTGPAVERVKISFLHIGREQVSLMLRIFPRLESIVAASYTQAIRFLEILGFTVEPQVFKVGTGMFRAFWMES